jgi:hypothetical protein
MLMMEKIRKPTTSCASLNCVGHRNKDGPKILSHTDHSSFFTKIETLLIFWKHVRERMSRVPFLNECEKFNVTREMPREGSGLFPEIHWPDQSPDRIADQRIRNRIQSNCTRWASSIRDESIIMLASMLSTGCLQGSGFTWSNLEIITVSPGPWQGFWTIFRMRS